MFLAIPLWILFIHGFATGFLTTWVGLLLININPPMRKLIAVGVCYAVSAVIIRSLPLPFGLHFYLLTTLLIFIIQWIMGLTFIKALIPAVLGNLIMALAESLVLSAILKVFQLDMATVLTNKTYLLTTPIPQIIIMFLLALFLSRQGIFLFNFDSFSPPGNPQLYIQRNKLIVILIAIALILLILQVFCIQAVYNFYPSQLLEGVDVKVLGIIMSATLIVTTFIILFLIGQLVKLINRESEFMIQQTYLETVDEMIIAIRSQQHDQISHLQTLYGYMQLGYLEDAKRYLEEMIGEIALSQRFANIQDPGLSALAYTKTAKAIAEGINFEISVNTDLNQLMISPYELNRILGNLIGNSFDHVSNLGEDMKKVWLRISREDNYYLFEVANYGHIDDDLATKIFDKGVTFKTGNHAGLGLSIVRELVNQHGGKIIFSNEHDKVIFSVYLPVKEDKHETIRPKISSPASPELA